MIIDEDLVVSISIPESSVGLYFLFEDEPQALALRDLVQEYQPQSIVNRRVKSKLTEMEDIGSLKRRKSSLPESPNLPDPASLLPKTSLNSNDFSLSSIQSQILQSCLHGSNIFFTGGAGTGKSTLLKALVKALTQKFGNQSVYVTATTGLAACSIGGVTIHQFGGIKAKDMLSFTQGSRTFTIHVASFFL